MNKVILTGNLARDVDARKTTSGVAVSSFTIAVRGKGKDAKADFINCVAYDKTGEFVSNYFKKGSGIQISGRLNTRNYEDKDGKTVYVTEVIVEEAEFGNSSNKEKKEDTGSTRPESEMPW